MAVVVGFCCSEVLFEMPVIFTNEDYADRRFLQWNWKAAATEYRRRQADSFRGTFQNLHRILRGSGSFPRGSAERVQVWIRDDGILDAGQRDPLTYVRRIYMRFDIALTQLCGEGGEGGDPCRLQRG